MDLPSEYKPIPAIKPFWIGIASLFIGIIWTLLFYKHAPGISVPIFWVIVLGLITAFDRITHKHMSWNEVGISITILALSVFPAILDSKFLLALNLIAVAYLFFLLLSNLYGTQTKLYRINDYLIFPILDIANGFVNSLPIFSKLIPERSKNTRRVIIGTVIAIVFALVFVLLFANADLVAGKLLKDMFSPDWINPAIENIIITVVVAGIAAPMLGAAFWKRPSVRALSHEVRERNFGIESLIVFIATNIVFTLFIGIQAMYFFGGRAGIEKFGLTYAEYARTGFFQLLAASIIVAGMIWTARILRNKNLRVANSALQVLLVIQTIVVLVSSWMRLSLYEEAFGFTRMRLFSHYFLIVVAVILLLLLLGIIIKKISDNFLLRSMVFVFAWALIILNIMNPDLLIAKKNIERAQNDYKIDYVYLFNLSDDAVPAIAEHIKTDEFKKVLETNIRLAKTEQDYNERIQRLNNQRSYLITSNRTNPQAQTQNEIAIINDELVKIRQEHDTFINEIIRLEDDNQTIPIKKWNGKDFMNSKYSGNWQSWNLSRMRAKLMRENF
ncbi:TPA: hypothetical protein DCZ32_01765 [Candidatus Uhrbacteria bacterium]|nr:hypothetical protein [Candidatus Uhrbacteria bacterium]